MNLVFSSPLKKNYLEIRNSFNKELFEFLAPPAMSLQVIRFDGCEKDNIVEIILNKMTRWVSLITYAETSNEAWYFIDEGIQLPWPLKSWKHCHRVMKVSENESVIEDNINYKCTSILLEILIYPFLYLSFALRPKRYQEFFEVL